MKHYAPLVLVVVAASAAFACDNSDRAGTAQTTAATTPLVDDTRLNPNERGTPTAVSQGEGAQDLATTQTIRKSLMSDDSLSTSAKNIAVITANGTITLRGTVNTAAEKQSIDAKAMAAAGQNRVDDRLDVVTKP
jgi:osmotically-inducible protein OsmY